MCPNAFFNFSRGKFFPKFPFCVQKPKNEEPSQWALSIKTYS